LEKFFWNVEGNANWLVLMMLKSEEMLKKILFLERKQIDFKKFLVASEVTIGCELKIAL
jgi:hypothetical protein